MKRDSLAMARERHIGGMTIETRCREHMHPIDGHALRLVNGGGVAVIEMGIVLEVERD